MTHRSDEPSGGDSARSGYSLSFLRRDLVAGLTVSVVELPQAMAYALIAGVPPQYGVFASVLQGAIGACLTSSRHLTTGPTNTQALLVASVLSRFGPQSMTPMEFVQLACALTVLKGLIQIVLSAVRAGDLMSFISRPVLKGVASGAGILIVIGQLASALGLPKTPNDWPSGPLSDSANVVGHASQTNFIALGICLLTIAIVWGARKLSRYAPGALIAILVTSAIVWMISQQGRTVPTVGAIGFTWPTLTMLLLDYQTLQMLFSGALALAILGGVETVAIAKSIAGHSHDRISPNRELFAQGSVNMVTGFLSCIPGSASFTRSALMYQAGAVTRFGAVLNAIFVGLLFCLVTPAMAYVPKAALAGILLVVAWNLIELSYVRRVWNADRGNAAVFLITLTSTLLLPLHWSVFVGVGLNILLILRNSAQLRMSSIAFNEHGSLVEKTVDDRSRSDPLVLLQIDGDLVFFIAEKLQERLRRIEAGSGRIVVLRLKRCHTIDATVLDVLSEFASGLKANGGQLILCGVRERVMASIRAYGLDRIIGTENLFPSESRLFASSHAALRRAEMLRDQLPRSGNALDRDEPSQLMYDI